MFGKLKNNIYACLNFEYFHFTFGFWNNSMTFLLSYLEKQIIIHMLVWILKTFSLRLVSEIIQWHLFQVHFRIRFVFNDIKTNFKKSIAHIKEPFLQPANSYKLEEFKRYTLDIQKIDARVYKYLNNIGHEKWTKVHSENNRFKTMTSILLNPSTQQ